MIRPLAEQTIVVTGASSGIGRATALLLARRGARLVLTARRAAALDALVREIERNGGQAIAVPGDVTREVDLRAAADAAVRAYGRIDTWINNAGVYIQGTSQDITLDEYRRLLDVNLLGYINGTKQALEVMQRQGSGAIIQVSSVLGKRGAAYFSAYGATKAGVDGFTQAVRAELWGTGIRISTIYLPPVDTPIYQHARGKWGTIPVPPPPVSLPEDVAEGIAELAENPAVERIFGPFGHLYMGLAKLPGRWGDWFLHHTAAFTVSDIPDRGDNLDAPPGDTPRVRGGWATPGWRGVTLRKVAKALPVESAIGGAVIGFAAARAGRRIRGG